MQARLLEPRTRDIKEGDVGIRCKEVKHWLMYLGLLFSLNCLKTAIVDLQAQTLTSNAMFEHMDRSFSRKSTETQVIVMIFTLPLL